MREHFTEWATRTYVRTTLRMQNREAGHHAKRQFNFDHSSSLKPRSH